VIELQLFPGLPGGRRARLGPITGAVEQRVEPGDPGGFAVLLDQLLLADEGTTVGPGRALDLAVADHDRIAAEIYCQHYGSRVESTLRCRQCGKAFEVAFDLDALNQPVRSSAAGDIEGPDESGTFRMKAGPRFRLPTLRDQLATRELEAEPARQELLRRCVDMEPADENEMEAVERAMESVGPLISGTITANCPHCDHREEEAHFSMPQYLLEALAFEKQFLPYEVHHLARAYGWRRDEILAMPTTDRRLYVRMIMAEATSGR
jgi:hypothetical protein